MCKKCLSFVLDYLLVPSVKGDSFHTHVHCHRLKLVAPLLAVEMYGFLERVTPSQSYIVTKQIRIIFDDIKMQNHPEDILWGIALYSSLAKVFKGEMDVIKTLVEDCQIIKRSMRVEAWLGTMLWYFWSHLPNIHAEHERNAVCSYAGPAMGMRSHEPKITVVATVDTRSQEQKEFDELYN